jgi:hypothetical protein
MIFLNNLILLNFLNKYKFNIKPYSNTTLYKIKRHTHKYEFRHCKKSN